MSFGHVESSFCSFNNTCRKKLLKIRQKLKSKKIFQQETFPAKCGAEHVERSFENSVQDRNFLLKVEKNRKILYYISPHNIPLDM